MAERVPEFALLIGVATGLPLGSTTATAVAAALTPSLSVALARNRRQPHRFRS